MTRQASPSPVRAQESRSPFVRLRELIGDIPPGKPAISMAVGEPQHPIPPFVGPVIAAHVDEFGRYIAWLFSAQYFVNHFRRPGGTCYLF